LAQQLRVTWRTFEAARSKREELAEEALEILERVLADGSNLSLLTMRCEAAALADQPALLMGTADYASRSIEKRGVDPSASYWAGRIFMAMSQFIDVDVVDERLDPSLYHEVRAHMQQIASFGRRAEQ
ncbi:MAG: hypothetical protein AAF368_07530, partial [Planctomycetota bacterium]